MPTAMSKLFAALSLVLFASACTTEETDPSTEFRTTESGWGCPTCTLNSPRVNDFVIPEFNLDGVENDQGVAFVALWDQNNNLLELDIIDDELVARDGQGNVALIGPSLIGAKLEFINDLGVTDFMHVRNFTPSIPSLAQNGGTISGYALAFKDPVTGRMKNVCPDVWSKPNLAAVTAIGGETYNHVTKEANPGQLRWVTLACSDEAAYKMKRLSYGPNSSFNQGGPATPEQRTATLKMLTADYCGDGVSYTAQGTEVLWRNAVGSVDYYQAGAPFEAVWTHEGAVCLSAQRIAALPAACAGELDPCNAAHAGEWTTWLP